MKKYLFGLTAITLAIGFSAFTKPAPKPFADPATLDFYFNQSTSSRAKVENVSQASGFWDEATGLESCGGAAEACTITVAKAYFHETSPNVFVLNDSAYIAANQLVETDDVLATIIADIQTGPSSTITGVNAFAYGSTVISADDKN